MYRSPNESVSPSVPASEVRERMADAECLCSGEAGGKGEEKPPTVQSQVLQNKFAIRVSNSPSQHQATSGVGELGRRNTS